MTPTTRCLAGVVLLLCLNGAAAAQNSAQDKSPADAAPSQAAPSQAAPAVESAPVPAAEPAPAPEPGAGPQAKCIAQKEGFTHLGKGFGYAVQLANQCETRMKCKVFAHISNAIGETRGHDTLVLAPKSKGKTATKTFEMKVKMTGGVIQLSRQCEAI